MYAEPARDFIEARGGERPIERARPRRRRTRSRSRRRGARRADRPRRCRAAVPWFALRTCCSDAAPPPELEPVIAAASAIDVDADRDGELWYDRAVMDESFVGLPGREMQWVFDKRLAFGGDASHLSLVSSGATRLASTDRRTSSRRSLPRRSSRRCRERAAPRWCAPPSIREKQRDVLPRAGQPARPGAATLVDGPLSRRRLDRHRPARHDRECGRQRPRGGESNTALRRTGKDPSRTRRGSNTLQLFMKSIVIHYQEIALKGKNRPWFVARLVRNLRERPPISGCADSPRR